MSASTNEPTVKCPKCGSEIKLTESLAAPLLEATRREYERALAQKDTEVAQRERALAQKELAVSNAREEIDTEIATRLKLERGSIAKEEADKARLFLAQDIEQKDKSIAELNLVLIDRNKKLGEAQQAEAKLKRKERELDDAKREMELTVETRVQESLEEVRKKALKQAEDNVRLRVAEKDHLILQMQHQIEDLKRKAEQGSQQIQGEVQELELESLLGSKFPGDVIEPVAKGQFGGDVLQHVVGPSGVACGTIIWESKRTKKWSDGWLCKLREDQRSAKADAAILVSQALPKDLEGFNQLEGIWVTELRCAVPVATVIRQTLIEIAATRRAGEGQQTKMELVYRYLTGPRFRERVNVIVEKFVDMQEDLDRERRSTTRMWAKREEQIKGVIETTAGLYGDLQGIAGKSLQEIDGLEVTNMLPAGERS